jgi:histidine ammonia-lyase
LSIDTAAPAYNGDITGAPAPVVLDGTTLSPEQVVLVARDRVPVVLAEAGLRRMAAAEAAVEQIVARQRLYGRNTGVGANRSEDLTEDDQRGHGLRLLRSHAGGMGELLSAEQARAMLVVRVNQLLAGGAGLRPVIAETLAAGLNAGCYPGVHEFGAIGTGDLTALAETGLVLIGERPWLGTNPGPPPITMATGDALALISSNALTIGLAALAWQAARELVNATHLVAGLSFLAVDGSLEPYAERVHAARPHPGQVWVAARMRALLEPVAGEPARVQDPFGYRCFPQVHGVATDTLDALAQVLSVEVNAAAENPLIWADDGAAYHHGGFHCAALGMAMDTMRLALLHTGQLSTARLGTLLEPAFTGGRPFLAEGPTGSSGLMILEYSAHSALAEVRNTASPASLGHAVVSRGVEDHSSFAFQSARQSGRAVAALRLTLACELLAAVRALRLRAVPPAGNTVLGEAYRLVVDAVDPSVLDHSLSPDVKVAGLLLSRLATLDQPVLGSR